MYYVNNVEKEDFIKMLDFLAKECDTFCLVEPNVDFPESTNELPDIKKSLSQYLKEENRVTVWPGTRIKVRRESQKAIQHIYRCCPNSIEKLKKFSSFFDIEDQIDISFFHGDKCVLFTISHEGILMVDLNFWQDFFNNTACTLIKAKNFQMIP